MSPYLITGIAAGVVGLALGFGTAHTIGAAQLSAEKASHQSDLAKINAASAKAMTEALAKQQEAESRVSVVEKQFNDEVTKHASDSLSYRASLAAGTERVRVRVASCVAPASGQSASPAGSADGAPAYGYLDSSLAISVFQVAADDQAEIDKLVALQSYVKTLQNQGFIGQ